MSINRKMNKEGVVYVYHGILLLLLTRFSRVRLCATPQTAAHQAFRPWDSPGKNTGVGSHFLLRCMKVKSEREVAQSCPTLSDPMDCSPPGSSVHGISQAKVLEWGAIAFSYSAIKNNKIIIPFAATWMDPETVTLSEVSQIKKYIHHFYMES